jgi:hypothetical protein
MPCIFKEVYVLSTANYDNQHLFFPFTQEHTCNTKVQLIAYTYKVPTSDSLHEPQQQSPPIQKRKKRKEKGGSISRKSTSTSDEAQLRRIRLTLSRSHHIFPHAAN